MNVNAPRGGVDRLEALLHSAEARASSAPPSFEDVDEHSLNDQSLVSSASRERERLALRRRHLPSGLSSDKVWLILLHLFVNPRKGQAEVLAGSAELWGLSQPTVVRYIAAMIEAGLIVRQRGSAADDCMELLVTSYGRSILRKILTHRD